MLIDDMERNIRDRKALDGTGIVNVNAAETMEELKEPGKL